MRKDSVEFYTDGRESWQYGINGWFLRKRGLFVTAIFFFLTAGTPWWLDPNSLNKVVILNLSIKIIITGTAITLGLLILAGLYYTRYRVIRSLDIKYKLHEFEHYLRDNQTTFFELSLDQEASKKLFDEKFNSLLENISQKTKEYFIRLCKATSIEVAIRLAIETEKDSKIVYKTMSRTSGLSRNRAKTSEPILPNEGIPNFFSQKDCRGVLYYRDLDEAARIGAFKKTINEDLYPNEIKTMMVAPLNAWGGKEQTMIGLLYITSRGKNIFSEIHTDSALFIADMISKSIAFAVSFKIYDFEKK